MWHSLPSNAQCAVASLLPVSSLPWPLHRRVPHVPTVNQRDATHVAVFECFLRNLPFLVLLLFLFISLSFMMIFTHRHRHTQTHMHMHTHTDTHTHTHTHTHTPENQRNDCQMLTNRYNLSFLKFSNSRLFCVLPC